MARDPVDELKDAIAAAFSENIRQDAFIQDFMEKVKQKSGSLTLAGLVDKVNESKSVEEAQGYFGEPLVNFHMHGYDSWVQANAKFRADAGMESKIIRRGHFGMCAWCAALTGTFEYGGDDMPKDVFRRHKHCKWVVLFTSERGKFRDVHSKVEYGAIRDARVARIRQLSQQRKLSPEELEARKNLHKEIVRLNPESLQKAKERLEKYSAYQYNADGTIIVTDDWTDRKGAHIPGQYKPYAVIDTVSQRGTQRDRTFFDERGWQVKQISNGPHGNPKRHPYGSMANTRTTLLGEKTTLKVGHRVI